MRSPFYIHDFDSPQSNLLANMNRIDCAPHKLDKVGKIDSEHALGTSSAYDTCHSQVFSKLKEIWKVKESRLKAERFMQITGRKAIGPHRIRWLKTCEAVSLIQL